MVLATSVQKKDSAPKSMAYCQRLANQLNKLDELPADCRRYAPVVRQMEEKQKAAADPFAGMSGATRARSQRAKGKEHHAQIQRRLTTMGTRRFSKLEK